MICSLKADDIRAIPYNLTVDCYSEFHKKKELTLLFLFKMFFVYIMLSF